MKLFKIILKATWPVATISQVILLIIFALSPQPSPLHQLSWWQVFTPSLWMALWLIMWLLQSLYNTIRLSIRERRSKRIRKELARLRRLSYSMPANSLQRSAIAIKIARAESALRKI